jgi:hypothetical protein
MDGGDDDSLDFPLPPRVLYSSSPSFYISQPKALELAKVSLRLSLTTGTDRLDDWRAISEVQYVGVRSVTA